MKGDLAGTFFFFFFLLTSLIAVDLYLLLCVFKLFASPPLHLLGEAIR